MNLWEVLYMRYKTVQVLMMNQASMGYSRHIQINTVFNKFQ